MGSHHTASHAGPPHTCSSNTRLLEAALLAMAELYVHVKELESWELFQDMFSFQCMVLDRNMATQAGNYSIARHS